jgi:hypothetical protein
MDRRRQTRARRLSGAHLCALLLCLCAAPIGCVAPERGVVDTPSAVSTELPEWVDVRTAIAAGEAAVRARGFVVHASESTADRGHVIGRARDPRRFAMVQPQVRVEAWRGRGVTIVRVYQQPQRNGPAARELITDMRARLGL